MASVNNWLTRQEIAHFTSLHMSKVASSNNSRFDKGKHLIESVKNWLTTYRMSLHPSAVTSRTHDTPISRHDWCRICPLNPVWHHPLKSNKHMRNTSIRERHRHNDADTTTQTQSHRHCHTDTDLLASMLKVEKSTCLSSMGSMKPLLSLSICAHSDGHRVSYRDSHRNSYKVSKSKSSRMFSQQQAAHYSTLQHSRYTARPSQASPACLLPACLPTSINASFIE